MPRTSRNKAQIFDLLNHAPDLQNVQIAALLGIPLTSVKVSAAEWRKWNGAATKRERVWALLDDNPCLSDAELSRLTDATVSTAQSYRNEWQRSTGYHDDKHCTSCEFVFVPDNPRMSDGTCLACWCLAHRVDQRRLFEYGVMTRVVAVER